MNNADYKPTRIECKSCGDGYYASVTSEKDTCYNCTISGTSKPINSHSEPEEEDV